MQHSKLKIAPAISGYIGIIGHTIEVKIPKRLNAPGVLTDFSLAILVPFLGKEKLSLLLSTLSSCKIISLPTCNDCGSETTHTKNVDLPSTINLHLKIPPPPPGARNIIMDTYHKLCEKEIAWVPVAGKPRYSKL